MEIEVNDMNEPIRLTVPLADYQKLVELGVVDKKDAEINELVDVLDAVMDIAYPDNPDEVSIANRAHALIAKYRDE